MTNLNKTFHHMTDIALAGKKVLIRQDYNVPIQSGVIQSDARLQAALPTLKLALEKGAAVMATSHLGRPTEGQFDDSQSLAPVAQWLSEKLGKPVRVVRDYLCTPVEVSAGELVLLENVRFNVGESACDAILSQQMANLCDVFVMDAFGTAHRAQASTYGVAQQADVACAGLLLANEIMQLDKALKAPSQPVLAIVGGSKVSTKLALLEQLVDSVDTLIVGGGIANTFLAASGVSVGQSLYEAELVPTAKAIMEKARANGTHIPLPVDVGVGKTFDEQATCEQKNVSAVTDDDRIFDIGVRTAAQYAELIQSAKTIIWNGPVGVFEFPNFAEGTQVLARAIADSQAFSIAGGGDTIAAIQQFNVEADISYVTTGGGSFLEYVEGKKLPAIDMLEKRYV